MKALCAFFSCSCVIALALLLCSAVTLNAQKSGSTVLDKEIRKNTGTLDSIKDEIDARRKKIRELEKAEGGYQARLDYLEKNINASKKYLVILSGRIDTAEITILRLTDSLHEAGLLLADRQALMKERLRRAYMTGMYSPLMALLLSKDPLDLVHRATYLQKVHRYDAELIGKIDLARQTIDGRKQLFEAERVKLASLLLAQKKEQLMLLNEEASRRAILTDIRHRKKTNQAMLTELQASQRQLNKIIKLLEQNRIKALRESAAQGKSIHRGTTTGEAAGGPFQNQRGKLPWPVQGTVAAGYGTITHPLYKTVIKNNGIDIQAKPGTQVRAVAAGTVIYIGSMRGLGRLIIVDHTGGYLTIYANLEKFSVATNQAIEAGAVLGSIGPPGETKPELHFEIRKLTEPVDPENWLEMRR